MTAAPARSNLSGMRLIAVLVGVALLGAGCGFRTKWTDADTFVEVSFGLVMAADYSQTRKIIHDPVDPRDYETNPVINAGVPPSAYFAGVVALHALAARSLRQPYRRIVQAAGIAIGLKSVAWNHYWGYPPF